MKLQKVFVFSSLVTSIASGAVQIVVSPRSGGGVQLVGSGTIDVSSLTYFTDIGGGTGFARLGDSIGAFAGSGDQEIWRAPDATIALTGFPSEVQFDTGAIREAGFFSIGATLGNLILKGPGLVDDGVAPAQTVFEMGFTVNDSDTEISDWFGRTWEWDSNGSAPGGETMTLVVIPEPTTSTLCILCAVGLVRRRVRR